MTDPACCGSGCSLPIGIRASAYGHQGQETVILMTEGKEVEIWSRASSTVLHLVRQFTAKPAAPH